MTDDELKQLRAKARRYDHIARYAQFIDYDSGRAWVLDATGGPLLYGETLDEAVDAAIRDLSIEPGPCPDCGDEAEIGSRFSGTWTVCCVSCPAMSLGNSKPEAVKNWNERKMVPLEPRDDWTRREERTRWVKEFCGEALGPWPSPCCGENMRRFPETPNMVERFACPVCPRKYVRQDKARARDLPLSGGFWAQMYETSEER